MPQGWPIKLSMECRFRDGWPRIFDINTEGAVLRALCEGRESEMPAVSVSDDWASDATSVEPAWLTSQCVIGSKTLKCYPPSQPMLCSDSPLL
jgi:hypothetical protein